MALSTNPEELVKEMLGGGRGALARLISLAEGGRINTIELLSGSKALKATPSVIGITGPPGAGKSTLADKLVEKFRARGTKVGVIAIDPSSPFTGGALLGDRVRMGSHSNDEGVFIRSLGSRGSLGGLSRATGDIIRLMSAFGAGCVLVETVGVGQSELDIAGVADTVVVVLVPESGDSIQTMKAGIMEIGDVFVVNKSDRKNAESLAAEISGTLSIRASRGDWSIPVLLTKATSGKGVSELALQIEKHGDFLRKSGFLEEKRFVRTRKDLMDEVKGILGSLAEDTLKDGASGAGIVSAVLEGGVTIPDGATKIAALITKAGK
ncbi:MAG: methylmalonyl Co-A mutase-associated GTPase MeaB [Candidatus Mycalebacterium zealandia]|nr:MAG: methylmalonyl Co-A mutase-associated GTPase MeaB [Candidatus Mycalebacterium zealandia]